MARLKRPVGCILEHPRATFLAHALCLGQPRLRLVPLSPFTALSSANQNLVPPLFPLSQLPFHRHRRTHSKMDKIRHSWGPTQSQWAARFGDEELELHVYEREIHAIRAVIEALQDRIRGAEDEAALALKENELEEMEEKLEYLAHSYMEETSWGRKMPLDQRVFVHVDVVTRARYYFEAWKKERMLIMW